MQLTAGALLDPFRDVHEKVRSALQGLDGEAIHWRPGPETNSVAGLVAHMVNSERRNLLRAVGSDDERDPDELKRRSGTPATLRQLIDAADQWLDEYQRTLDVSALSAVVTHPHRGDRTALALVLETYGHLKEHYGHLQLTKQLYEQSRAATSTRAPAPSPS